MSGLSCRECGRDNRADSSFCLGCGAALSNACPSCGRELPVDAGFCDGCGHRLAASEPSAARSISSDREAVNTTKADELPASFAEVARLYCEHTDAIHDAWEMGDPTVVHGDGHVTNLF